MATPTTLELAPGADPIDTALPPPTAAERLATANLRSNLGALEDTQPRLSESAATVPRVPLIPPVPPGVRFVFARDGYLTAFDAEGRWWAGCSLPRRAAGAMLKNLELRGTVACLLPPPHAASIRVSLDMTGSRHAIIALVPDLSELAVLLACDDFSPEIRQHRLWFAWGPGWADELKLLLEEQPGLPMPSQFIRVPVGEPGPTEPVISAAQAVFSVAGSRRAAAIQTARDGWRPSGRLAGRLASGPVTAVGLGEPRLCVVSGRDFRLWDDAAFTLAATLSPPAEARTDGVRVIEVCPDDPAAAGPLALLAAAEECDAVVTADTGRADWPDLLPAELPWLTWVTSPRLPAYADAGPHDALLVADPAWRRRAVEAGWPEGRVEVARWPDVCTLSQPLGRCLATTSLQNVSSPTTQPVLGLIVDCCELDPPARLDDFSSHRLLWNSIRTELEADPLLLAAPGADPTAYLEKRCRSCEVAPQSLDCRLFLERLIFPCYARSIARLLLAAGLPLRLFGEGWQKIQAFAAHAAGPVTSREALSRAVADSAALVHAWPIHHGHALDGTGKRVVRPAGQAPEAFIRAARLALSASSFPQPDRARDEHLSVQGILRFLYKL